MPPSAADPGDLESLVETPAIADVAIEPPEAAASFVRTAFGHGALYILGSALSQGLGFLLFPFFTRVLSPHDYGVIDLVGLAATLVGVTVALEVSLGLGRHFFETDDLDERRTLASTALIFTLVAYSLAAILALMFDKRLAVILFGPDARSSLMAVAILGLWCSGILYITQFLLQIQLRPAAFGVVTLVTAVFGVGSSAILVLGFKIGVLGALIGQPVGATAGAIVAFGLSRPLFRIRFDLARLKSMLAYSIPLIPASLGVFLNAYADRLAIRSRLSVADVGVYGAGYRLALIVSLLLLGLQGALSPLVLSRHGETETPRELARLFRLFCAIALTVLLLFSLFATELLHVLTRPAYYGGARVVPFVIAGSFFGGMYVFAPGLNIVKRTRLLGFVVGITGAVNLIVAFGLVNPLGIRGPALAFLVACGGGFVAVMVLSQRVYPVPHDWRRLLPRTAALAVLVAVAADVFGEKVSVGYVLAKLAIAAFGLALIAGLLDREEFGELVLLLRGLGQTLRHAQQKARRRQRARPV